MKQDSESKSLFFIYIS